MVIVFSTTKGISSLAFSLLHSWGLLNYDEKVATYWPEFAKNGKKKEIIYEVISLKGETFISRSVLRIDSGEQTGKKLAYRLFDI
jgi:hypothetical protein